MPIILGHSCEGGGATIRNSPIHLHIHLHTNKVPLITKLTRSIYAVIGRGSKTVEITEDVSTQQLSRIINGAIENK